MNKYEFTAHLLEVFGISANTVLDVGCRDGILRSYLPSLRYYGIDLDLHAKCDALVDISRPTPFRDKQFDLLIALDVAEHTDDIYASVCEMIRISRVAVIALPNMYNFGMRWRFLVGKTLCDKYSLTKSNSQGGGYRHRWLFTPNEAVSFMQAIADDLMVKVERRLYYPNSLMLGFIARCLPSSLGAEGLFFVFRS